MVNDERNSTTSLGTKSKNTIDCQTNLIDEGKRKIPYVTHEVAQHSRSHRGPQWEIAAAFGYRGRIRLLYLLKNIYQFAEGFLYYFLAGLPA